MTTYSLLKLVHVLCAIVGIGFTSTFRLIVGRARKNPAAMPFALETVAALERISTWAFTGLIVTGLALGHLGSLRFTSTWFGGSLVLAVVAMGISQAVARPLLRRQVALAKDGPSPELAALGARAAKVGAVLGILGLAILALMVLKPA